MTTQTLTLDQCPPDIRAFFLSDPGYQAAVRVTKSAPTGTAPTQVMKTLKTGIKKGANLPAFASILGGAVSRNVGDAPPAIPHTPAPTTAPTDAILSRAGGAGLTRLANNTPKEPLRAERGNAVAYKDLQSAIDSALAERHRREQAERFNAGRSAFSRIAKTQEHHVQGGGSGDAWSLRQLGGKLASAVLNGTTRKADHKPVGSSALDVAFGRGR